MKILAHPPERRRRRTDTLFGNTCCTCCCCCLHTLGGLVGAEWHSLQNPSASRGIRPTVRAMYWTTFLLLHPLAFFFLWNLGLFGQQGYPPLLLLLVTLPALQVLANYIVFLLIWSSHRADRRECLQEVLRIFVGTMMGTLLGAGLTIMLGMLCCGLAGLL